MDDQSLRILFTDIVYRLRYRDLPGSGRLEWTLDAEFDNDVRRLEGFWQFHPYASDPRRTLAHFGSSLDVGPMLPRMIQKRLSRKTILRYVENCRQWINSDGEWRP